MKLPQLSFTSDGHCSESRSFFVSSPITEKKENIIISYYHNDNAGKRRREASQEGSDNEAKEQRAQNEREDEEALKRQERERNRKDLEDAIAACEPTQVTLKAVHQAVRQKENGLFEIVKRIVDLDTAYNKYNQRLSHDVDFKVWAEDLVSRLKKELALPTQRDLITSVSIAKRDNTASNAWIENFFNKHKQNSLSELVIIKRVIEPQLEAASQTATAIHDLSRRSLVA